MYFEWDEKKNKINIQKHGVSFDIAKLVFDDPHLLSILDHRFNCQEERWCTIGSAAGRVLLLVVHTVQENEHGEEIIRIISARKAEKSERRAYLQNHS